MHARGARRSRRPCKRSASRWPRMPPELTPFMQELTDFDGVFSKESRGALAHYELRMELHEKHAGVAKQLDEDIHAGRRLTSEEQRLLIESERRCATTLTGAFRARGPRGGRRAPSWPWRRGLSRRRGSFARCRIAARPFLCAGCQVRTRANDRHIARALHRALQRRRRAILCANAFGGQR